MKSAHSLSPKLYQFLATAIELLNADKGNVQFYDPAGDSLRIVAHIGFNDEFLKEFETVRAGSCACGQALKRRERVIIEDTSKDPSFKSVGSTSKRFGYAAVQSTPLIDGEGRLFGVLSTHFRKVHRPTDAQLAELDEYLHRAAPALARKRAESK